MSYCRWSTDDFQSDVYVYESREGYETHVAVNRVDLTGRSLPPRVEMSTPPTKEELRAWVGRSVTVCGLIIDAPQVPIDLPEAGASFIHATPGECADNLERLRGLGFNVPQAAIDALREDAAQEGVE